MKREKSILRRIVFVCVVSILLAGCAGNGDETLPPETVTNPEPTETTVPETTVMPTTEATEPEPMPLLLEEPMQNEWTTAEDLLLFSGLADPRYPLEINGIPVQPDENGAFAYEAVLEVGENVFNLTYLEETHTFSVFRRYTTAWYAYEEDTSCCSGQTVYAQIFAREGSKVTIEFNGQKEKAEPSPNQLGSGAPDGFDNYLIKFDTPEKKKEPTDLGPIVYTVTCDDITEVYTSGNITCQAAVEMKNSDPEATPQTGEYRNVGSGYIVEIVDINAETFNGRTEDDKSLPTMNYLPKGTVDYGSQGVYYNSSARRYYHLLRCGVRVYKSNDNKPLGMAYVVDCYSGQLPDHNEIHVESMELQDHFTQLTLDCLWKAPFFFDEEAQEYRTEDWKRFILDEYDATYVDITFCYATEFTGDITIPEDNPLFSSAELIENEADYTLRLYLKEKGKFYGWNAYYNEKDQLCFKFLNPVTVTPAENPYGADLTGIKIMIDVGHGGQDPGAWYSDSNRKSWYESERNLTLANLVREELESIGATVVMNRTSEEKTVTRTERISFLLEQAPDFCICIHHNADPSPYVTGFESWYFTNFSKRAAERIEQANLESGAYTRSNLSWHTYFVARQTPCPIVLAENGYMSNKKEMDRIADEEYMKIKAQAIARGIVNYYLEESGLSGT